MSISESDLVDYSESDTEVSGAAASDAGASAALAVSGGSSGPNVVCRFLAELEVSKWATKGTWGEMAMDMHGRLEN